MSLQPRTHRSPRMQAAWSTAMTTDESSRLPRRGLGEPRRGRRRTARPSARARSRRCSRCLAQGEGWSAISSSVERSPTELASDLASLGRSAGLDLPAGHVGRDLAVARRGQDPLARRRRAQTRQTATGFMCSRWQRTGILIPTFCRGVEDRRARRAPRPPGRRSTPSTIGRHGVCVSYRSRRRDRGTGYRDARLETDGPVVLI